VLFRSRERRDTNSPARMQLAHELEWKLVHGKCEVVLHVEFLVVTIRTIILLCGHMCVLLECWGETTVRVIRTSDVNTELVTLTCHDGSRRRAHLDCRSVATGTCTVESNQPSYWSTWSTWSAVCGRVPGGCFAKKLSEARGNGIGFVTAGEAAPPLASLLARYNCTLCTWLPHRSRGTSLV